MTVKSADEFVEKFFNDDDFVVDLYKRGAFIEDRKADDDEQEKLMAKVAKDLGYNFSAAEYKAANEKYAKKIGAWQMIKKGFHLVKLARATKKQK